MADPKEEESFMESVSNYMGWTDRRGNANAVRINYPTPQSVADDQTNPPEEPIQKKDKSDRIWEWLD